nr:branched-chain amino acid ABC transporter substrate-binding protein [Trinickia mobilis]
MLALACTLAPIANAMAEGDIVKIGFAGPLTGPQAQYGKDIQNGVQLAIDEINVTKPVLDGRQVQFVLDSADDQADPRTGTTVAQRLVDDGVKGVIGHFNSGTSIPASAIYARANIPQITTASNPVFTRQGFATTFRSMTADDQQGAAMGTYIVKGLHAKTVAIIDDRTAYGQGLADQITKAVTASGGKVIDHEFTNDKAVDFRAALTKIKSMQPDVLFFAGADAQSAPLVKQMRSLGMKTTYTSGDMSKSTTFLSVAGDSANGTYASLAGLPTERMPGGAKYISAYQKKFNMEPGTYSPYFYDAALVMMQAMIKAGSSDPVKYLPVLKATNEQTVTTKDFTYDQKGDLKHPVVTIYKVEGGKWVTKDVEEN